MFLIEIVFYIALVGFLVWLLLQIPMPQIFKNLIVGIVAFAMVFWVLQNLGLIHAVAPFRLR